MRRQVIGGISVAFVAVFLASSATLAQKYPPLFPREGAKKLLENDRVAFWDVTWEKGRSTTMRESRLDAVFVTLEEGGVKVTKSDGTSTVEYARFGSVRFDPRGTACAEEGVSDQPRRAIVVELKPSVSAKVEIKNGMLPNTFPRPMAFKLFENDGVIVWDDQWQIGRPGMLHEHYTDLAWVFLEGGALHSYSAEGVSAAKDTVRVKGDVAFSSRMAPHREEAVKGPPRAIVLELK